MRLFKTTKFLLLAMAFLNILYTYLVSIGTECLSKFTMAIALFSVFYTVLMLFFEG